MKLIVLTVLLLLTFDSSSGSEPEDQEAETIRQLISSVENLQGAFFIRNGTEHSPTDAAAHLRMKLDKAGSRVRTAEDFIRLCASRSFLSRKAYRIKFANGTEVETETFLKAKLASLTAGKNNASGANHE